MPTRIAADDEAGGQPGARVCAAAAPSRRPEVACVHIGDAPATAASGVLAGSRWNGIPRPLATAGLWCRSVREHDLWDSAPVRCEKR
ncbi:hypothetical protein CTE05_37470 [Cellulomonas terrae]|uniref:Uncharacterized protein n=1 Tax=Cellulomonas terrae TaxID=311234 RepID=A0A511JQ94_9CELL|nr:hypothetical protein CTE05_37470 [Cellulomonas terrae]